MKYIKNAKMAWWMERCNGHIFYKVRKLCLFILALFNCVVLGEGRPGGPIKVIINTHLATEPLGAGDWSLKSEAEPHFLELEDRAKLDMELESARGCEPDGVTGVPGGGGCGPLWWVGDGDGAGLIELDDWPSECSDPVLWYIPVLLKHGQCYTLIAPYFILYVVGLQFPEKITKQAIKT